MAGQPELETLPRLVARRSANRGVVTRIFTAIESFRDDDDLEDQHKIPLIETQLAQLDAKLGELEEIDRIISTRGTQRYSRLAKLELSTFNGDIFQW